MRNLAILFPGQGSQYIGMGEKDCLANDDISDMFDLASDTLNLDMREMCFSGKAAQLNKTENTQPALMLCSLAAYRLFVDQTRLKPVVMAGHSLGELTALVASGSITLEDGLKLARGRGLAMSACNSHVSVGMSAVKYLDHETVKSTCAEIDGYGEELVIANYNSARQLVLSGSIDSLHTAGEKLITLGGTVIPLRVSGAFHSPYMAEAEDAFRELIETITISEPDVPVLANVDANPYAGVTDIKEKLVRQLTSSVMWQSSLENLVTPEFIPELPTGETVDCFIEAGPGQVLSRIVEQVIPQARSYSLDDAEQRLALINYLETDIRTLQEKPSILGKCLAVAVSTRNNNQDDSSYSSLVLTPYRQLKELHENCEEAGEIPDEHSIDEGFSLLKKILDGKCVSEMEQFSRFRELEYLCDAY